MTKAATHNGDMEVTLKKVDITRLTWYLHVPPIRLQSGFDPSDSGKVKQCVNGTWLRKTFMFRSGSVNIIFLRRTRSDLKHSNAALASQCTQVQRIGIYNIQGVSPDAFFQHAWCPYDFIMPCICGNTLACFICVKFSFPPCPWQPKFRNYNGGSKTKVLTTHSFWG